MLRGISCTSYVYSKNPRVNKDMMMTNYLNQLPTMYMYLFTLLQLVLRDNELIELPKTVGKLTRLKELHLQNNRLTVLPPELGMLLVRPLQ